MTFAVGVPDADPVDNEKETDGRVDVSAERNDEDEVEMSDAEIDVEEDGSCVPEEPPAASESCAKPTDGGLKRNTE